MKRVSLVLLWIFGVYVVIRAGVEFATMHYSDPTSYRNDWGGPSLAGVLAVHAGPGIVALGMMIVYAVRRRRR